MNIIETNLEFTSLSKRGKTNRIILHHSGVTVLQSVEVIHNYHKNTQGYAGIGYHFYVRKDGSIYRGRPEDTIGAHAYGANSDSIGICAEGDFNTETMSEIQKNAIKELVAYLKAKYGINTVIGHRDTIETSCPGKNYPFDEIVKPTPTLQCDAHIENIGWTGYKDTSKEIIGTEGQGKRLEAIKFNANNGLEIEYRVHIAYKGWQEWKKNKEVAGTTGQALRIEAIEIKSNKLLKFSLGNVEYKISLIFSRVTLFSSFAIAKAR